MGQVLDYIDLLIEIGGKIEETQYRLMMASEPGGRAEGIFSLGVSEEEVNSVLKLLSLGAMPDAQRELMAFGQKLFDGLMQSQSICLCYDRAVQAMLADRGRGIRLRVVVKEAGLQAIPWELLHDGDRFLAASSLTPMVRYVEMGRPLTSLAAKPPLRVLVATACPKGHAPLDVEKEERVIEQALQKSRNLVETTFLHNTSFKRFSRELRTASNRRQPYHILHFIGHGRCQEDEGELVFEEEGTRRSDYIDGGELGNVLCQHRHLRLVVLNACEGAREDADNPFNSVALSLLKAGIQAVVAMQFPISDEAATRFSDEFYYSLAMGSPVDVALGDARTQMYAIEGNVEFATPVLYMQAPDGKLFDVTEIPPLLSEVPETVLIPAGDFWMGSNPDEDEAHPNEEPQHKVILSAYEIGKYPITNAQYGAFVQATKHPAPGHWSGDQAPSGRENHPVVNISLEDARAFCRWLTKTTGRLCRLPAEEEWERAARGALPDQRRYPWGDEWIADAANTKEAGYGDTTPVDAFEKKNVSPFGVIDTVGNILEWTQSKYELYPGSTYETAEMEIGSTRYVVRGGCYTLPRSRARVSWRGRYGADAVRPYLGFRVAVEVED